MNEPFRQDLDRAHQLVNAEPEQLRALQTLSASLHGCSGCDEAWELHDDMAWCMNTLNPNKPHPLADTPPDTLT